MKNFLLILLGCILIAATPGYAQTASYPIRGKVIDRYTRQGVPYANVVVEGKAGIEAATDSTGIFLIPEVSPGICRLVASSLGYKGTVTSEYIISAGTPFIVIELEEDSNALAEVTVTPSAFRRTTESPVSLRVIGLQDIEKNPGSNRDVSRIVRSYPGVSFSPIGYRNDLIVRGGGPSENRFYMDGIEIPNINHFSTQGASGGPVSIVNADLIREINFYTGAFPANRSGALSSVLDFSLRDGNPDKQTFKGTLGASEVSLSGSGHFNKRTTYLFSIRQSYLQLLFKMLGLPFLPNYIDGQVKIKSRLTDADEITFLALAGIDKMKLNTDEKGEDAEYLLSYLPKINQETFTVGASYRHYAGHHTQSVYISHNYLNNRNLKYRNNDGSSEDNLTLRLRSVEQKTMLRAENRSYLNQWTLREGVEGSYSQYTNHTLQRLYVEQSELSRYETDLGIWSWGFFVSADYTSPSKRFTSSVGVRSDASDYGRMAKMWKQISPRISMNYAFNEQWSAGGNIGIYYQLPPYTALGFKDDSGKLINRDLNYMRVTSGSIGVDWHPNQRLAFSVEGFYKRYGNIPLSLADNIPLACKGNDYGVYGNEALISSAQGQSYGIELLARWQVPEKINITGSLTLFRSEYRNNKASAYIPSAWDNRFILNMSGVWDLPRRWSIGGKLSFIGGTPYTPYNIEKSSLVEAWDAQGRPYYNYSLYNTERLSNFTQIDLRVDKNYYFRRWRLGVYIDLQNVMASKLKQPDVLMSTGEIENPSAPLAEQKYKMKYLKQESGTLIPTLGITVEF